MAGPRRVFGPPVDPRWGDFAACRRTDPNIFVDDGIGSEAERHRIAEAQAICHQCDVRVDCLEHALRNRERGMVWGGLTDKERATLTKRMSAERHKRAQAAAETLPGFESTVQVLVNREEKANAS
jgi:WhiB family redox-sensing transcriptional regulator